MNALEPISREKWDRNYSVTLNDIGLRSIIDRGNGSYDKDDDKCKEANKIIGETDKE